jgi:hypothetical protein
MTERPSGPPLFQETQRLLANRIAWLGLAAAGAACLGGVVADAAAGGAPWGSAIGLLLGIALAWLLVAGRLVTEVHPDGVYLRFFPLTRWHRFPWHRIERVRAVRYRPIRDYGGWGVRWAGGGGRAYNVSGDRGVRLDLADGGHVLVGSQRADALAGAIADASPATPTDPPGGEAA